MLAIICDRWIQPGLPVADEVELLSLPSPDADAFEPLSLRKVERSAAKAPVPKRRGTMVSFMMQPNPNLKLYVRFRKKNP